MSRSIDQRRRFRIERLEERLVPGCLLWNGGLWDQDIDAVAASFSADAAPAISRNIAARASHRLAPVSSVERRGLAQLPISPQADELLSQIDREFSQAEDTNRKLAAALLESVDERFNIRPTPATVQPLSAAEKVLLEIDRELKGQAHQNAGAKEKSRAG
jgi:hypothetical protein